MALKQNSQKKVTVRDRIDFLKKGGKEHTWLSLKYDFKPGLYYEWTDSNEREIESESLWNGLFEKRECSSIIYWNGYAKTFYNFAHLHDFVPEIIMKEYKKALSMFDLTEKSNISPDEIVKLSNYKDYLNNQLLLQYKAIQKFNDEIIRIFKVYYFETVTAFEKTNGNKTLDQAKDESSNFSLEDIRSTICEHFEVIDFDVPVPDSFYEFNKLKNNPYICDHLIEATINGLKNRLQEREPLMKVSRELLRLLKPVQQILESAIIDKRVLTAMESMKKNMPNPDEVASGFIEDENNTAGIYDKEIISLAMYSARDFIIDNEISSLKGKKRTISKYAVEENEALNKLDLKTIDRYVDYYFKANTNKRNAD